MLLDFQNEMIMNVDEMKYNIDMTMKYNIKI